MKIVKDAFKKVHRKALAPPKSNKLLQPPERTAGGNVDTGPPSSWTTTFRECRRQGPAGQADRPRVSVRQTPLLGLGEASRALQPPLKGWGVGDSEVEETPA